MNFISVLKWRRNHKPLITIGFWLVEPLQRWARLPGPEMTDCYETICRFPNSEKGSWLRGLLKETGHGNFVLSGPWNACGEPVGVFGNSLEAFHLLLKSDGPQLVLRASANDQKLVDRRTVELLVPLPVAQRFAEDLGSARLWGTLRGALHVEGASPKPGPPITPR